MRDERKALMHQSKAPLPDSVDALDIIEIDKNVNVALSTTFERRLGGSGQG